MKKLNNQNIPAFLLLTIITLLFSWKYLLKGLIPIPADLIVGIYYPWRDYIWNNFVAGVPFKNSLLSDVVSIIYPWRIYGIDLLKQGIAPLWIPHALGGAPLLANFQSGLLYPFNFLFFIFPKVDAWSLYILLQPLLASLFTYIYLRNLKLSQFSSIIGGIIFAFSGFMMVWFEYGIIGHAALWLPLFLFFIDQLSGEKYLQWIIVGSFFVCFSILAGYPQVTVYSFVVISLYAFYRFFQTKNKKFMFSLFSLFFGILLSGIQLLPGLELLGLSIRQTDPTTLAFSSGIIPFKNLVLLIAPDFFGNPVTGNWWGKIPYNETAMYVGIFGLTFAIFAFISNFKKDHISNFFKIILILSLLFSLNTPLASLPRSFNLPGLSAASGGRFLFLVDFVLSILAAFGLEMFINRKNKKKFLLILGLLGFLFLFLWLTVLAGKNNLAIAQRNLLLPSIFFTILIALGFLNYFVKIQTLFISKGLMLGILVVIIFDLFRFGWKYNPFTPRNYLFPETKTLQFLQNQNDLGRFTGLIPQSMFIPYNLLSAEGYEPLMVKRYSEFAQRIDEEKFSQISTGSRWISVNRLESPLLKLLGTKYFLTTKEFPTTLSEFNLVFQDQQTKIYQNSQALPRIFVAHNYQVLRDDQILKTLMDNQFLPINNVLFEENPLNQPEKKIGQEDLLLDKNAYYKNQVRINTKTSSSGYLVLTDTDYPGWQATIDNQPTKIYRADYIFRAVFLPKGNHQVNFSYFPNTFKIGTIVSGVTLLLLSAGLLFSTRFIK